MQIFGSFTSPFVRHVRIAAAQTRTECEFIETDAVGSAKQSPTMKVPFLRNGNLLLSDSMSILRYIREQAGQPFLPTLEGLDMFCLVNTLMDSAINLFLLQRNGLNTETNPYFDRQRARIETGLDYLENLTFDLASLDEDAKLRLQCFLAWGIFRERFTLAKRPLLASILTIAQSDNIFTLSAPPQN
jgi:glutathione S-transferase